MSEWKAGTLKDIAVIEMGQSPSGETCNSFGQGIPLLNGPTEFGIKNPIAVQYTIDAKRLCKPYDILFCVRGSTTGKMNWSDLNYAIGRGLAAIRHKNGEKYRHFVRGIIDCNLELLLASATGSTFPNVSRNQLEELEILIPPLPEQTAIASILSCLDDKIDLLHRQNATLEKMAETLFRQWFVEKENNATISQLISIQNGYAFKSKDFKDNGTNGVIKIKNISGGIIDIEKTDFVNDEITSSIQERFKIITGDILIAMTGAEIGKLGIIPKTNKYLWLNQRVGLLKEKYKGAKYLAYLQLKSEYGQDYIENTATGSAQPNISGTGIENCGFPELNKEEIVKYSLQIGELYDKVIFNLGQIRTLTSLRDTLLPKLMSGEVKVEI